MCFECPAFVSVTMLAANLHGWDKSYKAGHMVQPKIYCCNIFWKKTNIGANFGRKKSTGVSFCQRERYWCELLPQLVTFLQLSAAMHCND